jgi:predicted permease
MSDLRFAFRQLQKNPGFSAAAVLTLALCLGANLTIFAVVDSVLLRPLPFPEADRLVTMFNTYPKAGVERGSASLANYYERRTNLAAFSHIAILHYGTAIIGDPGSTEQEEVNRVSPDFFTTLGVEPSLGRIFTEDETTYRSDNVAILTDSYWKQHFAADPKVLGRQIRVNGFQKTIVGVLPASFRFLSSKARLYFPLSSDPRDRTASQRHSNQDYVMIARIRPHVTLATAQAQVDADNAARAEDFPDPKMIAEAGFRTIVTPLHTDHVKSIRPTLLLLQVGVFLLFIIGAVNLVNLLLIRATGRAQELAVRLSLGATHWHVIQQVICETLTLSSIGGLLGLTVAAGGIRLLTILGVGQLPLGAHIDLDWRLALVAILGAIVTGLIISGPIAWFNLQRYPSGGLHCETRAATVGRAAQRLRHGFIIAQIAFAFVLLAGAGLLGLSLKKAMDVPPGFRPDHLLTGQISLPWKNYPDWTPRLTFIQRLLGGVRSCPGVSAAGVINNVPLTGENSKTAFVVEGHVRQPGESLRGHYYYGVGGEVFAALGIPLREGRFLDDHDSDRRVCVVDEDFARRYWPNGGAVGHKLFAGADRQSDSEAFTVVGVVGPIKHVDLTENQSQGAVYVPYQYRTAVNFFSVVRTIQRPEAFSTALQKMVRDLDPELPVNDLRSMEVRIADSLIVRRSPALLAGIFASVALLLAAIGTYGVLAYAVNQRRREIGVRMALGALPKQIGRQFLSLGLRLLAAGLIAGVCGAWLAGRAMQSVLFGVTVFPLATTASAAFIMTLVALIASWLPARRAVTVDPMEVLRYE